MKCAREAPMYKFIYYYYIVLLIICSNISSNGVLLEMDPMVCPFFSDELATFQISCPCCQRAG